jgi:hypothetical protein
MDKRVIFTLLLSALALPFVIAYEDNYFSVKDNAGPYSVLPGEALVIGFTMSNRDLLCPRNVTAYIDPCPVGWECEEKTFCYDDDGYYPENLTMKIPATASPKKYTAYILLKGDYMSRRGNDRVLITVLTEEQASAVDYTTQPEESIVKEPPLESVVEEVSAGIEDVPEEEVVEIPDVEQPPIPEENKSQLVEDFARLESNTSFMEYFSAVLVVLLVFVIAGAYMTFRKRR